MMKKRIDLWIGLALICVSSWLFGLQQSFHIEEWEKGLNRRQPPIKIMDAIGLKQDMVIGEIGAGTGRMTMWLSQRVGDKGKVFANDIDTRALERLLRRCKRDGIKNIKTIIGDVDNPKLPSAALDIVFMINVYHHLSDPLTLIQNTLPSLKANGYLAIVECDPDKVDWGEDHGCIRKMEMTEVLMEAGFEVIRIETFLSEDNIYIAKPYQKLSPGSIQ